MNCNLALINWFNTNQGFSMVLLTTVYVVATVLLVCFSNRANRIAQKNLESLWELERERTRPHVVIRFEFSMPLVSLSVSNIGQTSALNVHFEMPEKPTLAIPEMKGKQIPFLNSPISSLAPQESLKTVLGSWKNIREAWSNLSFSGTVFYKTTNGIAYSEPFSVNLADQEGLIYSSKKGLNEIAEAILSLGQDPKLRSILAQFPKPPPYVAPEQKS